MKVMMTNLMSFIMVIILGTPVFYYMNKSDFTDDVMSYSNGWLLCKFSISVWFKAVELQTEEAHYKMRSLKNMNYRT